jgi:hypothetical protein
MTVPDWKIERYLLGELPEGEITALKALEGENSVFRLQIEQLKSSNEELLAAHPYKRNFRVIFSVPLRLAAAFLLCATALIAVFSGENIFNENNLARNAIVMSEDGTRVKGLKTDLEIWRKTDEHTEKLADNSVAKAGDLLQIRYSAMEHYGVLLSLDGNGVLTIHLAGKNGKSAPLEAGKIISLENAYELDNAPKFETFYLFTADMEFELAPIAEKLLQGKMPNNLQITQVTLKKR